MGLTDKFIDLKGLIPGTAPWLFKQHTNCDISIKTPSLPTVSAIFNKENMKFIVYDNIQIPVGVTIVDEHENRFSVRNIEHTIKEYENKKGEKIQCKIIEIAVVIKEPESSSLLGLVKQESINNSNIKIVAQGDVHIEGDIGSISLIQKLDLNSYWNYLKKDILNLFESKSFSKDIEDIDAYFIDRQPIDTDKIKKSFKKIILDSIRNFALDFLVKLTMEISKSTR